MNKVDTAQQRGKSSHSGAAWKKDSKRSIVEEAVMVGIIEKVLISLQLGKVVIAQQRGNKRHSGASWKR